MRGLKLVLLILAVFLVSACWFALQQVAGYTLPLPWPDEVVFFFSAKNFAEYQSLLTPELNPNRQLMWFPPGFAIITGLLLKFTDASYGAARLLSALFMAQSFLLLFLASRKFSSKSVAWLLLLGGFFSMHVIIAGNLVRPEALVLFLLSWAFYLNVNKKGVAAISIASLAILVHPVSSLAVLPICIISLDRLKGCRRQSNWWQWILLGVAICSFQCYAVELSANWSAVVHDYNHQLNSRNFSLLNDFLMEPINFGSILVGIAILMIGKRINNANVSILGTFAIGLLLLRIVGMGYWYGIYRRAGLVLEALAVLEILSIFWRHYFNNRFSFAFKGLSAMLVLEGMLFLNVVNPLVSQWKWQGMQFPTQQSQKYVALSEIDEVKAKLFEYSLKEGNGYVVFYPSGDMCFYDKGLPVGMKPIMPVMFEAIPKMVVYHNNSHHTDEMKEEGLLWMRQYVPYINNAYGFSTKAGNKYTVYTLGNATGITSMNMMH